MHYNLATITYINYRVIILAIYFLCTIYFLTWFSRSFESTKSHLSLPLVSFFLRVIICHRQIRLSRHPVYYFAFARATSDEKRKRRTKFRASWRIVFAPLSLFGPLSRRFATPSANGKTSKWKYATWMDSLFIKPGTDSFHSFINFTVNEVIRRESISSK